MITDNRRNDDVSNSKMSKLFSVEIVGSIIATAFIMGAGYRALAGDQEQANIRIAETTQKIHDIERQQQSIKSTVANIQTDTAVIRNDQTHMNKTLEKNSKSIEKVLEILMKHDSGISTP